MPENLAQVLQITLYDPETDAVLKTYSRSFVPWRILKAAIRLQTVVADSAGGMRPDDLDQIAGLVVETFGNQFSIEDLNNGADVQEMMTVLQVVIARAHGLSTNPTPPG